MARRTPTTAKVVLICERCGVKGSPPEFRAGMCWDCYADTVLCPRCGQYKPRSENRGSYCRECKAAYNAEYYRRRRGLPGGEARSRPVEEQMSGHHLAPADKVGEGGGSPV